MKYFHTTILFGLALAACAMLATPAEAITITTDDGNGADAQAWKGPITGNQNFGSLGTMLVQDYSSTSSVLGFVRLDVSGYVPGSFTSATLSLTSNEQATVVLGSAAGRDFRIHGLLDGQAGNNWGEGAITYNNAPGLLIGGGLASADIDPAKTVLLDDTLLQVDNGLTADLSNAALLSFLNADTDGLVTFIVSGPVTGDSVSIDFAPREHATLAAPTLTFEVTAVPEPASVTLALTSLGVLGLVAIRRRRRNRR